MPHVPVDLKSNENKIGLREFYGEKKPANHYEKTAVFVYYITKINKQSEVKYGEILSSYEEVDEKKPSITDIIKNLIRYKGWLEQGSGKFTTRLSISGENFVKFDLPQRKRYTSPHPVNTTPNQILYLFKIPNMTSLIKLATSRNSQNQPFYL